MTETEEKALSIEELDNVSGGVLTQEDEAFIYTYIGRWKNAHVSKNQATFRVHEIMGAAKDQPKPLLQDATSEEVAEFIYNNWDNLYVK